VLWHASSIHCPSGPEEPPPLQLFHLHAFECAALPGHLVDETPRLVINFRPALVARREHLRALAYLARASAALFAVLRHMQKLYHRTLPLKASYSLSNLREQEDIATPEIRHRERSLRQAIDAEVHNLRLRERDLEHRHSGE